MGLKDLKTVTRFSQLSLLGHVPAFSGALLDVSLAKDSDTLMRTQPSLRHLVILNLVVALSYLTLAHHNFYRTRGWWPYVVVLIRCPLSSLTNTKTQVRILRQVVLRHTARQELTNLETATQRKRILEKGIRVYSCLVVCLCLGSIRYGNGNRNVSIGNYVTIFYLHLQ